MKTIQQKMIKIRTITILIIQKSIVVCWLKFLLYFFSIHICWSIMYHILSPYIEMKSLPKMHLNANAEPKL
jgi:hypothetical protein